MDRTEQIEDIDSLKIRVSNNLDAIRERIRDAAQRVGRAAESVELIAVTKSVGLVEAGLLNEMGVKSLAENRVEIAREKIAALQGDVCWHMVGSIQRRKVREVVALFDRVDSVDRLSLAHALNKECELVGKTMPVLVQVNVSGEESKHGFNPEELAGALDTIERLENLTARGLMTMAPQSDDEENVRPVFASLRELGTRYGLKSLSMGMTNDFETAIEEGATEVRIGTALYQ